MTTRGQFVSAKMTSGARNSTMQLWHESTVPCTHGHLDSISGHKNAWTYVHITLSQMDTATWPHIYGHMMITRVLPRSAQPYPPEKWCEVQATVRLGLMFLTADGLWDTLSWPRRDPARAYLLSRPLATSPVIIMTLYEYRWVWTPSHPG